VASDSATEKNIVPIKVAIAVAIDTMPAPEQYVETIKIAIAVAIDTHSVDSAHPTTREENRVSKNSPAYS
jgi:hypothetical protein